MVEYLSKDEREYVERFDGLVEKYQSDCFGAHLPGQLSEVSKEESIEKFWVCDFD